MPANRMWMKSESDSAPAREAPHAVAPRQPKGQMFESVAPREVQARLRRRVAKPQVKLLIGVSDPTGPHGPKTSGNAYPLGRARRWRANGTITIAEVTTTARRGSGNG
jgi:hypothetical protein